MNRTVTVYVSDATVLEFEVTDSTTLQDLVASENLSAYDFTVDGRIIARDQWAHTYIGSATDIWASRGVKGAC